MKEAKASSSEFLGYEWANGGKEKEKKKPLWLNGLNLQIYIVNLGQLPAALRTVGTSQSEHMLTLWAM